ncbi:hypothetical protein BRADI_4g03003v3 [Brachypodium distachyon]|uniref:Uncharacterized protein n=1 Tax=Brachypodium distachyon TaxID=15368 RepID=A0A2K2CK68_BRADI|nr:hypothetical protein BRADI_4g03003v3 [Brachypodium distachyon]
MTVHVFCWVWPTLGPSSHPARAREKTLSNARTRPRDQKTNRFFVQFISIEFPRRRGPSSPPPLPPSFPSLYPRVLRRPNHPRRLPLSSRAPSVTPTAISHSPIPIPTLALANKDNRPGLPIPSQRGAAALPYLLLRWRRSVGAPADAQLPPTAELGDFGEETRRRRSSAGVEEGRGGGGERRLDLNRGTGRPTTAAEPAAAALHRGSSSSHPPVGELQPQELN